MTDSLLRSFCSPEDTHLLEVLRDPHAIRRTNMPLERLFERAERHGLAGVLSDLLVSPGVEVPHHVLAREMAREADHAAHLRMIGEIDSVLHRSQISAALLKGALLAERLYPRPSVRPSTDIDLLVSEGALDAATDALADVGYRPWDDPAERHFRKRGHHIHLVHTKAPPLELHFHAFRGFGSVLSSEPLLARSIPYGDLRAIRVPSVEDELAYLSIHAAAHRFMRLGWLYDVLLLVRPLDITRIDRAVTYASDAGLTRPMMLALELLEMLFGWTVPAGLARKEMRIAMARAIAEEQGPPLVRSATRFAYSLALCEDWKAAKRYVRDAISTKVERLM